MKKLNRKGYMLVEIIVSFSISFIIFISLTNLVLKFKDVNEETYYGTKYLEDKTLITRNIMKDLEKVHVINVVQSNNDLILDVVFLDENANLIKEKRKLLITDNTVTYGKFDIITNDFIKNDYSYYTKTLESSLNIEGIESYKDNDNKYFYAKIEVDSIYTSQKYDINLYSINKDIQLEFLNVKFEPNGGSVETTEMKFIVGSKYEGMPIPVREGYIFDGWYTELIDGTKITETSTVSLATDHTLYARWKSSICEVGIELGSCIKNAKTQGFNSTIEADLYRYQGTNVDNYVCFGTNSKDVCLENPNTYLYRIIGVNSDNQVKLIKKETLNSEIKWFTNNTDITWPNSILYSEINGNGFLTNETYVPNDWNNKISTTNWKYGDLFLYAQDIPSLGTDAASDLYTTENGWTNTIDAKIGLMYIHDYFYAFQSGGLNCNNYYSQCKESWIHLSNNDEEKLSAMEWTMMRHGYNSYYGAWVSWLIYDDGTINWGNSEYLYSREARPVFYLENNVKYASGIGTLGEPFIIL